MVSSRSECASGELVSSAAQKDNDKVRCEYGKGGVSTTKKLLSDFKVVFNNTSIGKFKGYEYHIKLKGAGGVRGRFSLFDCS